MGSRCTLGRGWFGRVRWCVVALVCCGVQASVGVCADVYAEPGVGEEPELSSRYVSVGGQVSFLSESTLNQATFNTLGYEGDFGYRWGDWGAFVHLEHNLWPRTAFGQGLIDHVINAGLGGEVVYFDRHVSTRLVLGTSTALFDTVLTDFGETGFFVDLRPVNYRLPFDDGVVLRIEPLAGIVMVPITRGIPLVNLVYRSGVALEFAL